MDFEKQYILIILKNLSAQPSTNEQNRAIPKIGNQVFIFFNIKKCLGLKLLIKFYSQKVIRKGYMALHSGVTFRPKDFWFVLTTESLAWFKDEEEKEKKYMIQLDQLKIKDLEGGMFSKRHLFALFTPDGRYSLVFVLL